MALRTAILRHLRVPVQNLTVTGSNQSQIGFLGSIRSLSSHDDHLSKEAVVDRVLDVVKSFPKVDPAKVSSIFVKNASDLALSMDNLLIRIALVEIHTKWYVKRCCI